MDLSGFYFFQNRMQDQMFIENFIRLINIPPFIFIVFSRYYLSSLENAKKTYKVTYKVTLILFMSDLTSNYRSNSSKLYRHLTLKRYITGI